MGESPTPRPPSPWCLLCRQLADVRKVGVVTEATRYFYELCVALWEVRGVYGSEFTRWIITTTTGEHHSHVTV